MEFERGSGSYWIGAVYQEMLALWGLPPSRVALVIEEVSVVEEDLEI